MRVFGFLLTPVHRRSNRKSQHLPWFPRGYFSWSSCTILTVLSPRTTTFGPNNTTSKWLAGLRLDHFPGNTVGEHLAYAAGSIKAGILSPTAVAAGTDPALPGYIPFTTKEMINQAHKLGVAVKPWTVSFRDRLRAVQNTKRQTGQPPEYCRTAA